ncbi:hypothetical protein ASD24_10850 [Paenibacillus sp. Root52]|uniref:Lipoprotein n=1 Tax=Paenibacillus amylolyticus TaxID=1451 RepID=A0AAP5H566_PAEAM|nr:MULTISPECIES: hypothetical protein [Paenibacillus]KQY84254.1 hypothetical protein ASD24_10850 [Paenibacillus sp. Root52]MDR6724156.1 hypothetical protein [Paenibacillus amylolyticus]
MKMKYVHKSIHITLMLTLILTACTKSTPPSTTTDQHLPKEPTTTIETVPETNSLDSSQDQTIPELPKVKPDVAFKLPFIMDSMTIKNDILERNTVVASYRDDNGIVFFDRDFSTSEVTEMEIIQFDTKNNTYTSRYRSAKGIIINTLVSVGDDLFWIENPDKATDNNTPWQILRMKRDDLKAKPVVFAEGNSEDQIAVPVLRTNYDEISWIEKKITDDIVKSEAYIYDVKTGTKTKVATQFLNEQQKNKRDGIFLDLQKPVSDGLLIRQTVFENKDDNNTKKFDIVMYPKDQSKPEMIVKDREDIFDFTANEQWIVLTMESTTEILDRKTKKQVYSITHDSSLLGGYSPFLFNNQLIYHQAPYIMAIDLTTGNKQRIVTKEGSYTPIYNFGDKLTFTRMEYEKDSTQAELFFLDLNSEQQ